MKKETAYLFKELGFLSDDNGNTVKDKDGRPVKLSRQPSKPFEISAWQPFSVEIDKTYGLSVVESYFRFSCDPNEAITFNTEMVFKNVLYKVEKVFPYNSHFRVIASRIGDYVPS
jgi:hypothetical protein